MAQIAIAPQRKIKSKLLGVSGGSRHGDIKSDHRPDNKTQDRLPVPLLDILRDEPSGRPAPNQRKKTIPRSDDTPRDT